MAGLGKKVLTTVVEFALVGGLSVVAYNTAQDKDAELGRKPTGISGTVGRLAVDNFNLLPIHGNEGESVPRTPRTVDLFIIDAEILGAIAAQAIIKNRH